MIITDELRKYADRLSDEAARKSEHGFSPVAMKLEGIADRIDAEHEAMLVDARKTVYQGYIELPKDADGEYIRIGDEMEGVDKYDSLKKVMGKVITVSFESDGIVDVAIRAWNSDGKSWRRAYLDPDASVYRHHHAPTVEDVLVVTEYSPQGTAQRRYVPEESEKVVRCKDCRHAAPLEGDEQGRQICWLRSAGYIVEPDGFCAWGERKTDA